MPVPYQHLYYRDFKDAARKAGVDLKELEALDARKEALYREFCAIQNERRWLAKRLLTEQYAVIRPFLRPCHQKRFDAGTKEVELMGDWD